MKQEIVKEKINSNTVRPELKVTGVTFNGYPTMGKNQGMNGSTPDRDSNDTENDSTADKEQEYTGDRNVRTSYLLLKGISSSNRKNRSWINRKYDTGKAIQNQHHPEKNKNGYKNSHSHEEERAVQHCSGEAEKADIWWQALQLGTDCQGVSRKEMIRVCGIREQDNKVPGVKTREQIVQSILNQEEELEVPAVCSVQERLKMDEHKRIGTGNEQDEDEEKEKQEAEEGEAEQKGIKEGEEKEGNHKENDDSHLNSFGEESTSKKSQTVKKKEDKTSRKLLRDYVIKEMLHEEGKGDPNSHYRLMENLLQYNIAKAVNYVGKAIGMQLLKIFISILPFLIAALATILPLTMVVFFIFSPISYFSGIYDKQEEVRENPLYVKNVLQELYGNFHGEMSAFKDSDGNNQVIYEDQQFSVFREVISVYLARISTADGYGETGEEDNNYPPYLLVDTDREREMLWEVFEEFNHLETEDIEVTVKGEDGMDRKVNAKKMTVTCITVNTWKEAHLHELTEDAQKMLDILLGQAERAEDNYYSGEENAVPISDLVIPDGVDENLVYLAGFLKAEAGNQPYQGKIAVVYVILNRAGGASGNIKGVLTAPYQFSCYIPYHTVEKYLTEYASMTDAQREQDACWIAAKAAYTGAAANPIGKMKYYCNPKACSVGAEAQWRKIRVKNTEDEIIIIGDHVFCSNCW